jgi:hypothetical protein
MSPATVVDMYVHYREYQTALLQSVPDLKEMGGGVDLTEYDHLIQKEDGTYGYAAGHQDPMLTLRNKEASIINKMRKKNLFNLEYYADFIILRYIYKFFNEHERAIGYFTYENQEDEYAMKYSMYAEFSIYIYATRYVLESMVDQKTTGDLAEFVSTFSNIRNGYLLTRNTCATPKFDSYMVRLHNVCSVGVDYLPKDLREEALGHVARGVEKLHVMVKTFLCDLDIPEPPKTMFSSVMTKFSNSNSVHPIDRSEVITNDNLSLEMDSDMIYSITQVFSYYHLGPEYYTPEP